MLICYVAQNELFAWKDEETLPLSCQRIEQYQRAIHDLDQRHAWKSEGAGAQFQQQVNPFSVLAAKAQVKITALAGKDGSLFYGVNLNHETGGLSQKNPLDNAAPEGVVLSQRAFDIQDLFIRGDQAFASVLCSKSQRHIARLDLESGDYEVLTSGDTVDRRPSLSPDGQWLYYDAMGYARDDQGAILGLGPATIMGIHLPTGRSEEILADEKASFCGLTQAPDGSRYVMTRPYTPPTLKGPNPLGCLLSPFYILQGLAAFVSDIAQARKGQKPQWTTNAGVRKQPEKAQLDGQWVDIEKALAENQRSGEKYPGITPGSWKLEKLDADGKRQPIARGVLTYCLSPDGALYYANGRHIIRRDPSGAEKSLIQGKMISLFTLI